MANSHLILNKVRELCIYMETLTDIYGRNS